MANKPRGDATPVKKYDGKKYMPVPYGPEQKLKQAKRKRLPSERPKYNV